MFLRTLPAIRARCTRVHDLAQSGALQYFDYHPEKLVDVIAFCASIIQRDFASRYHQIPPHGRWRHLDAGHVRIDPLLVAWSASVDATERCKRLLDLVLVSVLLDAGAGNAWSYLEPGTNTTFARSEGLAVASVHMFTRGLFSGGDHPCRVDADGLARLTVDQVSDAMQVTKENPMVGIEGRTALLVRLASALASHPQYFGPDARPGNMIDFLATQAVEKDGACHVPITALWSLLMDALVSIWPSRHTLDGVPLGDVWPCPALCPDAPTSPDAFVPFHKLTGWLTYSLIEPITRLLGWEWQGVEDLTGLPEYRNGGLLVDFGVLSLRPNVFTDADVEVGPDGIPRLSPGHPAIVEWRAMTVIELDRIAQGLRLHTNYPLTLAQVLESATWKGGREIARIKRPESGGPPIEIISDGTVF